MNSIIYRPGHGIPRELIVEILENIGCKEIINNDYDDNSLIKSKRERCSNNPNPFHGMVPDLICTLDGEKIAVEVGSLSEYDNNKVKDLLNYYPKVIHIFADNKQLLLHTIIYKFKKEPLDRLKKHILKIEEEIKRVKTIIGEDLDAKTTKNVK